MRRLPLFLLIILVAVVTVISSVGTFLPHQLMMSGTGRMMEERSAEMGNMLWPSLLTTSIAVIVVVVAYIIAYPSIKYVDDSERKEEVPIHTGPAVDPMDIVMRVAKPDERAALQILKDGGGVCLQRDITYKTGLSKLKTHRIVARLAERGIVQVRKVGKTNEISVPTWLKRNETNVKSPSAASGTSQELRTGFSKPET